MAVTLRALKPSLRFRLEDWRMWMWMSAQSTSALLERVVDAATRRPTSPAAPSSTQTKAKACCHVEDLFLRIILSCVSSPRIFRVRARLLLSQGYLSPRALDSETYLEDYRASQMEEGGRFRNTSAREVAE